MDLFIRIKDGQPFEHPIFGDNFREVFPNVDVNNLPPEFARFERIERPLLGVYEVMDSEEPTYELIGSVYKDVWHIRNMTAEEKTAKQQAVITNFNSREQAENWAAWTFDEVTCSMQPPIPRPELIEGVRVWWCGADNNWKEVPAYPVDSNQYKFDFLAWQWVQVVN
jgi:hypothetical protein